MRFFVLALSVLILTIFITFTLKEISKASIIALSPFFIRVVVYEIFGVELYFFIYVNCQKFRIFHRRENGKKNVFSFSGALFCCSCIFNTFLLIKKSRIHKIVIICCTWTYCKIYFVFKIFYLVLRYRRKIKNVQQKKIA